MNLIKAYLKNTYGFLIILFHSIFVLPQQTDPTKLFIGIFANTVIFCLVVFMIYGNIKKYKLR